MKILSFFVLSSSLATASGIRPIPSTPVTSQASRNINALIIPRGGANIGPLEAEALVKAFCGLALAQGLAMQTGPKSSNEMYGLGGKDNDAQAQYQAEVFGSNVINIAVMVYMLLAKGASLAKVNMAIYAISGYQCLLFLRSGRAAAVGSEAGVKVGLAICAGAFWAMTQDFSDTAIKALAAFWLLAGGQMMFDPEGKNRIDALSSENVS